jgi:hypothetical protein
MYNDDVPSSEITRIIDWACKSVQINNPVKRQGDGEYGAEVSRVVSDPVEQIKQFLNGFACTIQDLERLSPWKRLEDFRVDPIMHIAGLYDENDLINVITDFKLVASANGESKAVPQGSGKTLSRNQWMREMKIKVPQSAAGAWMRMNPVLGPRPSRGFGFSDCDIADFRFCLVEADSIPLNLQCSFFAKLRLPIAAVIGSGGRSLHAWVKVDAKTEQEYRELCNGILKFLKPFGFDQSNKNPSRLSRLPGVIRQIGGAGDGKQTLHYLNPDCSAKSIL